MKKIYDYGDYRSFIRSWVTSQARAGHGQYRKIASHLNAQTSYISQVMNKKRELSDEQASQLGDFFAFNNLEADYFLLLVQKEKAAHPRLRLQIERQIEKKLSEARQVNNRISKEYSLSEAAQAAFYSQWYFSGIRLCTAIPELNTSTKIANYLNLPPTTVARVLDFLLTEGLVVQKNEQLGIGPKSTHISADSPLVARHHANWRIKCLKENHVLAPHEIQFTGPAVISKKDREKVRTEILKLIESWSKVVDSSGEETLTCLTIDWLDIS